jgi:rare lipoprotein A
VGFFVLGRSALVCLLVGYVVPADAGQHGKGIAPHGKHAMSGMASVYDHSSGARTASGERVQEGALTAAHPSLPFGTMVAVSNKRNGRTVTVRINDRGPFVRGRVIDLTPAAAHALSFSGTTEVSLAVVSEK